MRWEWPGYGWTPTSWNEACHPASSFLGRSRSGPVSPKPFYRCISGKLDLCLVTKNGFDTMVELNPQVGRSLSAIAHSPILISEVTCFRRTFTGFLPERYRQRLPGGSPLSGRSADTHPFSNRSSRAGNTGRPRADPETVPTLPGAQFRPARARGSGNALHATPGERRQRSAMGPAMIHHRDRLTHFRFCKAIILWLTVLKEGSYGDLTERKKPAIT